MFNIPNLLTGGNMLCGCLAILLALFGRIDLAPLLIFIAFVFDFLDGFVARKLKNQGEMGKQLDSLADMVTFGIAPGVIMMIMIIVGIDSSALVSNQTGAIAQNTDVQYYVFFEIWSWMQALVYDVPNNFDASIKFLPFIALIIPFLAMFRLAKFNLDKTQDDRFRGVPTPMNTLFFLFFPLFFSLNLNQWEHQDKLIFIIFDCYSLSVITVLFSLLMIIDTPLISLKFKTWNWPENKFRYILIVSSLIIIFIFWIWSIIIIVFLYIILSMIENLQIKRNEI
jgi:CDP-diacylglycerol---serine O-phosphatidyltransferase